MRRKREQSLNIDVFVEYVFTIAEPVFFSMRFVRSDSVFCDALLTDGATLLGQGFRDGA